MGSTWNIKKRALLAMCYPEIPSNDIIFGKRTLFGQILQKAVSHYQILISSGLFLDQNLRLLT